jgi:hypothetical protein
LYVCGRDCVNSSLCLWLIVFSACCDRERRRLDDVSADAGKRIAAAEHAQVEAKKAWLKDMALAEALIAELKAGVESERGAAVAAKKEAVFAAEQVGRFCQTAQSLGHSCPGCAHTLTLMEPLAACSTLVWGLTPCMRASAHLWIPSDHFWADVSRTGAAYGEEGSHGGGGGRYAQG